MAETSIIDLTPDNIAEYGVCGCKDARKHKGLRNKIAWFKEYYPKGLRIKVFISNKGGCQGMLEYLPGKYAHRPVKADGYMFIHCIFAGFKNEFKHKGYASCLIDECIKEAKEAGMSGVAVVTREGSFMADKGIFLKKGFEQADRAEPDFSLLALKFDTKAKDPSFKPDFVKSLKKYKKGLTILRSAQCPYTEKNVNAIAACARDKYKLNVRIIDLKDYEAVQNVPCAFGSFCLILDGKVISHHPISNTRFENIMKKCD